MINTKKILVVGGSGFVGSNLIKYLDKKKNKILATYFTNKIFTRFKNVNYKKGNLLDYSFCKNITKNIDTVYMCAAFSAGAKVIERGPIEFMHLNTLINLNILKACNENNVKNFIFFSSSVVYPDSSKQMKETDVNYSFFSKYNSVAWMKIYSEKVCKMYNDNMNILIVRPGNLYGPFDKFDSERSKVIPSLIRKFDIKKKIEIFGTGQDVKDFIYIEDFIKLLLIVVKKKFKFKIINIASGKSIQLLKIIKIIQSLNGNKKFYFKKKSFNMIPVRKINIKNLENITNYKFKFDIKLGLIKTVNWYKKNKKKLKF